MLLNAKLLFVVLVIIPSIRSNPVNISEVIEISNQTTIASVVENQRPDSLLSTANNDFSFKIFKMLSKEGNNDVLSPLSINMAFSILMNGAENETLDDMRRFLGFNSEVNNVSELSINEGFKALLEKFKIDSEPTENSTTVYVMDNPAKLRIANRVFRNESIGFLPEYESAVKEYFKADIQSADFANNAVEETNKVNEWVKNATNNKINKIFDIIPRDTTFVIINALHFQGQWYDGFSVGATNQSDFYNNGTTPVKTDMMFNEEDYGYYDSEELDAQVLEMDYYGSGSGRSDLSFVVVLPKQRNGLNGLKERLNAQNLKTALSSLQRDKTKVYLPKFKVEAEYDLIRGISPKPLFLTFGAQFSRLSNESNVVAEVKHKVYIDVNEKGTEAAAVTAVRAVLRTGRFVPHPYVFRADHPFLYLIRDRSNDIILFMGQIVKF